jgi:hypothetical protein
MGRRRLRKRAYDEGSVYKRPEGDMTSTVGRRDRGCTVAPKRRRLRSSMN